ncbi:altronate dehydratase small subunit [Salsuginibacillus halophilus]|uniref:Altronate dehydratase small subunit n=1 Tax=Salsuginibacillus halophilus TaxID=517424 RepID=A0A2P8HL08_9BACI|nr:UxaA family hydrolase [Salsuginibacillus halophilus]PSL46894.1 altronate dehydratase small subunit [Salsuginibacillus halophilus]
MSKDVYVINPDDNTGTVIKADVTKGTELEIGGGEKVKVLQDIPYGHKIAVKDISTGDTILKYGLSIGSAIEDIPVGDHIHVHNIESNRGRGDRFAEEQEGGNA